MEPFNSPPPIPTPDGQIQTMPASTAARGDWQAAPKIIKGWAYPLTWLAIVLFALFIVVALVSRDIPVTGKLGLALLYAVFLAISIWLNRALKKGVQAAWTVQIIVSVLGLLGFPLGTLIHGYILSQWFKPETKAWFGMS